MKRLNKKTFVVGIAALAIVIGTAVNVSVFTKNDNLMTNLSLANVEALADDVPETGLPTNAIDCANKMGNWNMASICEASGFENSTCKVAGKISAFGIELSGSYEKGKTYEVAWARYNCTTSNGNCCIKVGLYTGDTKLA